MYVLIKPETASDSVYIRFPFAAWQSPTAGLAQPLSEETQWLVDHKIDFGFINGLVVGVYLSNEDAVIFKLKFGA